MRKRSRVFAAQADETFVLVRLAHGGALTAWRQGFVIPWTYELREPPDWSGRLVAVKESTVAALVARRFLAAKLVDSDHATYTITDAGRSALA